MITGIVATVFRGITNHTNLLTGFRTLIRQEQAEAASQDLS